MSFNKNKKLFLYEVEPLFFKDFDNDGFGDFEGFFSKIDYFEYLKVDGIIFPDLFNQEKDILKPSEITIFNKYGKLVDLKKIIDGLYKRNIDFFIELNLGDILDSNMNKNLEIKNTNEFLIKELIEDEKKSLLNNKKEEILINILNFWQKQNINNFIFTNFEHLYKKNNQLDPFLIKKLSNIYKFLKKTNSNISIGLKSHLLEPESINHIFNDLLGKICDFFIDNSYAFVSTNQKHPRDIIEKFNPKKIINKMQKLKISPINCFRYVICFDSNLIGRTSSRWIDEKGLHSESMKTLLMVFNLLPYSSINYYGNEVGTLRTNILNINDYYDFSYNERKRKLESNGYSEKKFHYSQKYLSPIHSQSIFSWDTSLNSGFSSQKKLFRKPPIRYYENNVKIQFNDPFSILNFYKNIISFVNESSYSSYFDPKLISKIKIKFFNNLIIYSLKSNNKQKLFIILNLTNKTISKKINKKNEIVISTYKYKYLETLDNINYIKPYESIIYISKLK